MVDGDRGLAGNRFNQPLVLGAERLFGGANQHHRPEQVVLGAERRGQHGLRPPLGPGHLVAGIFR